MDKKQQESRRKAAHKFMSALDELKVVLQSEECQPEAPDSPAANPEPVSNSPQRQPPPFSPEGDLESLLDDAVQDIERFMSEHPDTDEPG